MDQSDSTSSPGEGGSGARSAVMIALAAGIAAYITSPFINRGSVGSQQSSQPDRD